MRPGWRNFDWILLGGVLFLGAAGLVSLASSNVDFFWRQLVWYGLALLIIFFGSQLDWRFIIGQGWFRYGLYWLSVLLLIFVAFQSFIIRGVKSWIVLGGLQFEPSELAKVALIIMLAGFFARRHLSAWVGKNIFVSFVYTLIPAGLIAIQPDFGSAVIILGIWAGFLLVNGVHLKRFLIGLLIVVIAAGLLWSFFLKPYQKERFIGFVFPKADPLGINYNVIQSKIAIGSAGFLGKGFDAGTQVNLNFLPEAESDFIFAAFTEEWGILGAVLLILVFLLVIWRIMKIGRGVRDNYSKFISLGFVFVLAIQFVLNIGSNIGFLPVTGIILPFVSYGGSSLLTLGVLVSIMEHIKLESSV